MKAVIKGSAFLGFVFVVFSMGCADSHKNTNAQGTTQNSPEASPQAKGFVTPDLTTFKDAQGTTEGTASQEATDGSPGTPFQFILNDQITKPGAKLVITNDDLVVLAPELKAGLHIDNIRAALLKRINEERAQAGVKPVTYDKVGELAANIHVKEQLDAKSWLSHYSLDGDLPYMRYSRANGYDANSENAAVWSGGAEFGSNLDQTKPCTTALTLPAVSADTIDDVSLYATLFLECLMITEKAPDDGHRQTILNPDATMVGISIGVGIWEDVVNGQKSQRLNLFLVEEFQTRGLKHASKIPLSLSLAGLSTPATPDAGTSQSSQKKSINFSGQLQSGLVFDHARLYFEVRKPKTVDEAQAVNHYSLPEHFKLLLPPPSNGGTWEFPDLPAGKTMDFADNVTVQDDQFSIPLPFDQGPGVYTVYVMAKRKIDNSIVSVSMRSIYVLP